MAKTQSLIFTIYDDYIRHYNNRIWVGSLIRILEEFTHNPQSVRMCLSRMTKQGWLSSNKEGKKSFYSLTEAGENRLNTAAKSIFNMRKEKWDGHWLMVVLQNRFDDTKHKQAFMRELEWHGFGQLSANVYVTPNPLHGIMDGLVIKYDLQGRIDIFSSKYTGGGEADLIRRCWNIDEINNKYDRFFEKYSRDYVLDKQLIAEDRLSPSECFVKRVMLTHEYKKFLFIDPGFPDELLPEKWLGHHANQLFTDYYQLLGEGAIRFFEEVFKADNAYDAKEMRIDVPLDSYLNGRSEYKE